MDFGIAARVAQREAPSGGRRREGFDMAEGRIVGTPGYISPEAARGAAPVAAMDVFAAGVVLGELLNGAQLMRETDPFRYVERVQREDMVLPAHVKVDTTLRGIVQRALSRDIGERYDSARSMHTALQGWLHPEGAAEPEAGSSHATLEFLLRRMKHKTDFPALSSSIVRIQRVAVSETESLRTLSGEILKDVALTNKLLRMVNTAHFTAVSGGGIATVSRAVALVGFAGIRNMALSVVLLEHMSDKAHASLLKEEFLRAVTAGTLADELTPVAREAEEAFLGAMFQNLGRLLAECYLPEEAQQIRQAVQGREGTLEARALREVAAKRVLGLSLDELGAGVAKAWSLPDTLQLVLRVPDGEVPAKPERGSDRQRWMGRMSADIADAMLGADGEAQADALRGVAERYAAALDLSARDIVSAAQATRLRVNQLAQAMGVSVPAGAPARRLLEATQPQPEDKTMALAAPGADTRAQLSRALDELRTRQAAKTLRVNDLLQLVLDTMHKAVGFRCVVLCLRDPASGNLLGRVGLGPEAAEMSTLFRIKPDLNAMGDLFAWLTAKGADLLVSDSKTVIGRLPTWYRENINAPTFLLLPLMVKGKPIGLIYADKNKAGQIVLGEGDLALLRALRDQAAAAFGKSVG
jgi:HD-like signal output (HDOD) protein